MKIPHFFFDSQANFVQYCMFKRKHELLSIFLHHSYRYRYRYSFFRYDISRRLAHAGYVCFNYMKNPEGEKP
jgi:hypothetical protein